MILANLILATTSHWHTVHARTSRLERQNGEIFLPEYLSNFQKANVTAQWAPGHPKPWGTETERYEYLDGTWRGPNSFAAVTDDEKYLLLWDGTRVQFTDLSTKKTAATFEVEKPPVYWTQEDLMVKPVAQGGYDILVILTVYTMRQRVTANLEPVGNVTWFEGRFADITTQGNLLTNIGYIYDLDNTTNNNTVARLNSTMNNPFVSTYRTAPDGEHLGYLDWYANAKLVSATSGDLIFTFGSTQLDGNQFDFSPDGKYLAVITDSGVIEAGRARLRVHDLSDLSAAPIEMAAFDSPGGSVKWSSSGKQLAVSDSGRLQVFEFASRQVTQTWQVDFADTPGNLAWHDGDSKLSWVEYWGQYLYDFETNLVYLWSPTVNDRAWKASDLFYLEKRGYFVTEGGDKSVRFWKI